MVLLCRFTQNAKYPDTPRRSFLRRLLMSFTRYSPVLAFLVLILPTSVWANSVTWQNVGGQITASGNVLSLSGSTMSGLTPSSTSSSGLSDNFSFTTGPLVSGTLSGGGTFAA